MKKGDIVNTPNGKGVIVDTEEYSRIGSNRYGVKLENNPFWYPVAYYFTNEITKHENQTQITF
jgi:hypothetical protein